MIRHDSGLGISKKASLASKVNAKRAKSGMELPFPQVKNNHYDLLWIGHINQKFLMFKHGAKFKVIFNALWNMEDITDMGFLRDQMLKMR